jgi:hypothetical protein
VKFGFVSILGRSLPCIIVSTLVILQNAVTRRHVEQKNSVGRGVLLSSPKLTPSQTSRSGRQGKAPPSLVYLKSARLETRHSVAVPLSMAPN